MNSKKVKIVFIERIFPHYRKAVYDIIYSHKYFLFFHTLDKKSAIKQVSAQYSIMVKSWHYSSKESGVFMFTFWKLLSIKPKIVIHEFSAGILSIPLVLLLCRLLRIRFIFWGHMYDRSKGFSPPKKLLDKYRLWLWRQADSLITYSHAERQLLINYKIHPEKIFVAFNTVDTNAFLKIRRQLEEVGRSELKKHLNFKHEFNFTFIGRLYEEKKPELLLELMLSLKNKGFENVAIHYVGHGEMYSYLKKRSKEIGLDDNVFFHGAIYDEVETGKILFCSDLMIMPGCVGLSVNHAFCFNCPVVTYRQVNGIPAHGPEIEYVIDGKTGFQIADQSIESLTDVVTNYIKSFDLRKFMGMEIKNFIEKECSAEQMAAGVLEAIDFNSRRLIKG